MAKALKNKVNPKHTRRPLVGATCNVTVPAANLLGGWCLIYSFTYVLEWVGHRFLVPYFACFVTLVNHFTSCTHHVQQQLQPLMGCRLVTLQAPSSAAVVDPRLFPLFP